MNIYEYLFAGIIIVIMLIASSTMVDMLSKPARDASQKEQLKITAQKIMTQILLDPGFPFDWGSNQNEQPQVFGLAKYGETSREAYLLDPDKVQRLNAELGNISIPVSTVLQLLNLGHDYGFNLEFSENLQVTAQRVNGSSEKFEIKVNSYFDQMPLASTKITAALYDTQVENVTRRGSAGNITGYDGTCEIDFGLSQGSEREVLIVLANYYGARGASILPLGSDAIKGYLFSNQVVATERYSLYYPDRQSAAMETVITEIDQNCATVDFGAGSSDSAKNLVLEGDVEPSAVAVLASVKDEAGQPAMLTAYRDLTMNYTSIAGLRSAAMSYSLQRTVLIAGTTYTVTLYLWRTSN